MSKSKSIEITVGSKVEAGVGEDYDTGRVLELRETEHGTEAYVGWDTCVATWYPVDRLSLVEVVCRAGRGE